MTGGAFGVYVMSITGGVILLTVADLIMPKGQTSKYIKSALSVFLVLIILTPIVKIKTGEIQVGNIFSGDAVAVDYSFSRQLNRIKADSLNRQLQKSLEEDGYSGASVNILYTDTDYGMSIDMVIIDLSKTELSGKDGHIDVIYSIRELAAKYLNIDIGRVYTYGAE